MHVNYFNLFDLQTFGWTPQEAKMHVVSDYFTHAEVSIDLLIEKHDETSP